MEKITKQVARRIHGIAGRVKARCVAGLRDERGATAVFFAMGLLLLAPATMGLIDIYMITTQRGQLQDALDTATLYVARSSATSVADVQTKGDQALRANLKLPGDQKITSTKFVLEGITIKGEATIEPPSVGPQLWAQADIRATSEVLRNSNNVEVALVLDTTGSMQNYMTNLKTAAKDLIDLVVKDQQKPYYTKLAIVPYSVGVNMGTYEAAARGGVKGATAITAISKTKPIVVTSANHGLYEGERLVISGVDGMTALNGNTYIATGVTANTFKLQSYDLKNLKIVDVDGTPSTYNAYKSGGTVQCKGEGCSQNIFTNASSSDTKIRETTFNKTACATERLGAHAYDDAAPGSAPVGWHYAGSCPSKPVVPLSTDKTALKGVIDTLSASGSTAGHIGLAWGWYMVSPEWKGTGLWTGASAPAAYGTQELLKVVVLMTDGAFNTPYCRGVAAKDSGDQSPAATDRINCNATNGDPFVQAAELCRNMKAKGVIIYTVGFNVSSDTQVQNLMKNCATTPEYAYLPNGGAELKVAFRAIAQDINSLRISK